MKKTVVGLTGQSGAGKTTVSSYFEKAGFYIINADKISRTVIQQQNIVENLRNSFGDGIFSDGQLDRKKLAKIVFSDKNQLNKLNSIMFPAIYAEIELLIKNSNNELILLDAPQLFESKANQICNYIIAVVAPEEILIQRAMTRDGISYDDAKNRLNSQLSVHFFESNSDYIINNNGDYEHLIMETQTVIAYLKK